MKAVGILSTICANNRSC